MKKISILLRDSDDSQEHNIRIMEYLNDRHKQLNNVGYAVSIDIVDDDNINIFIKRGVSSITALVLSKPQNDDTEYGVSSIIATLAKLEVPDNDHHDAFSDRRGDDPEQSFKDLVLKEALSGEQEDENMSSSIRAKGQDIADRPPNDKDIDAKLSKYESYYSERNNRGNKMHKKNKGPAPPAKVASAKQNVEKLISEKGYDKGEAAFMREIARNLD